MKIPEIRRRQFSGSKSRMISEREKKNREFARLAAEEGIVLLKNDGILPLNIEKPVGLFGSGAGCTIKGGTGSGDVNVRETVSVYQGMTEEGFSISSADWVEDYLRKYAEARLCWRDFILRKVEEEGASRFFDNYVANPFQMPEGRMICPKDLKGTDTAVYVISRNAGEGDDRSNAPGDYQLSECEKKELSVLSDLGAKIVVLINSGAQIDLEELLAFDAVKAILFIAQPGMEGGRAVAGILSGRVTPSGKLTDTWAVRYEDFPSADTFSYLDGDVTTEYYTEGIYVGYRYFDAAGIRPRYPFGYGLSYTEFEWKAEAIRNREGKTDVTVVVKNVGNTYSGKEVVQIYLSCPQGRKKELKKLVAYGKTKLLDPREEQILVLTFGPKDYAFFDEQENCWKVDPGQYILLAGTSSEELKPVGIIEAEETQIVERVHAICPLQRELKEWQPDSHVLEMVRAKWLEEARERPVLSLGTLPMEQHTVPVNPYETCAKEIVEQLTDEQLVLMSLGEISRGHDVALGAAGIMVPGAAGETSGCLEQAYKIPAVAMADGPAGVRIMKEYQADEENGQVYTRGFFGSLEDGLFLKEDPSEEKEGTTFYQYCTAFPVGIMMAQTWNREVQEDFGRAVGIELEEMGLSWWLAPGMNIHRNPLCGRNFEYFSEDPLVSGYTAAAITKGVQSLPGTGTTIKHFACNNLERNRTGSDSIVGERALREIYLRGFEIAIKESQPMAVMSSYNLVNGVHTASSKDLLTEVLRSEWGFAGIIMTDWTTTIHGGTVAWEVMNHGGNLIMPGGAEDIENLSEALKNGKLDRKELKERISCLIAVMCQTNAFEGVAPYRERFEK